MAGPLRRPGRLDLACGTGALSVAAAAVAPTANRVAVDLSVDMPHRAAAGLLQRDVRLAVAPMNTQLLAFPDRAFGTVWCGPASLQQMICAAGLQDVRVRVEEFAFASGTQREWWQWVWSHGFRQVLEQLPAERLAIYRRTAFEGIARRGIAGRMEALIAIAARHEP